MKEHDFINMSGMDDKTVEQISETVNALSDCDKDKIFADCMAKMNKNIPVQANNNIKAKRSGIKRFIPYISAAACFVVVGGALLMFNMFSMKSSDSANSFQNSPESADYIVNDNSKDCEADGEYEESDDSPSSGQNGLYNVRNERFASLMDRFCFAYALTADVPPEHEENYMYTKTDGETEYQYYRVTDSRVSSVEDIEKILKEVFSEKYYENNCSGLITGEYSEYEDNDGVLYTRISSYDNDLIVDYSDVIISSIDESHITAEQITLNFGQKQEMIKLEFINENGEWKIDSVIRN